MTTNLRSDQHEKYDFHWNKFWEFATLAAVAESSLWFWVNHNVSMICR